MNREVLNKILSIPSFTETRMVPSQDFSKFLHILFGKCVVFNLDKQFDLIFIERVIHVFVGKVKQIVSVFMGEFAACKMIDDVLQHFFQSFVLSTFPNAVYCLTDPLRTFDLEGKGAVFCCDLF